MYTLVTEIVQITNFYKELFYAICELQNRLCTVYGYQFGILIWRLLLYYGIKRIQKTEVISLHNLQKLRIVHVSSKGNTEH